MWAFNDFIFSRPTFSMPTFSIILTIITSGLVGQGSAADDICRSVGAGNVGGKILQNKPLPGRFV